MTITERPDFAGNANLVLRAAAGEQVAWNTLVDALNPMLTGVVRSFRLSDSDVHDIVQTTWLRLVQHIGTIEDPARVGAWLVTTARREALRVLKHRARAMPVPDEVLDCADDSAINLGDALERSERAVAVRALLDCLNPRQRRLMDLLMSDPAPSYESISAQLNMPIGSIGPTRGRCLRRLMETAEERGFDGLLALAG